MVPIDHKLTGLIDKFCGEYLTSLTSINTTVLLLKSSKSSINLSCCDYLCVLWLPMALSDVPSWHSEPFRWQRQRGGSHDGL